MTGPDRGKEPREVVHVWEYQDFRSELLAGEILYEVDAARRVAHIIFNRPESLNAIPLAGFDHVTQLIKRAERDENVDQIVFEGRGPCFGTGADARELGFYIGYGQVDKKGAAKRPSQRRRMIPDRDILFGAHGVEQAVSRCLKPTIAKVHGYCYGGHLQIALAADLVIAGEDALFTHPAWRYLGPIFNMGLLIETIGLRKVKEMVLTARPLDAREAERCGLITKAVPNAELDKWVDDFVKAISLQPRDGIAMGKAMIELVMDARGAAVGSASAWIGHGWLTNMKLDADEWNFLKARRDNGLSRALDLRDEMAPEFFRMSTARRRRKPGSA